MLLSELENVINENTHVKISIAYGYKNWNRYRKWDCKWKEIKEEESKEDLTVETIEPHEGYLFITVHR